MLVSSVLVVLIAAIKAFNVQPSVLREYGVGISKQNEGRVRVSMGLFDSIFGPKRKATASHILVKGKDQLPFLSELKDQISKSKDVKKTFAESASKYSTCPSSKQGGSLGSFAQGAMVPAFDKVVFSAALNEVHGPVTTPFGYHLILIESRSE